MFYSLVELACRGETCLAPAAFLQNREEGDTSVAPTAHLRLAISTAFSEISHPTNEHPTFCTAIALDPLPTNGSHTTSPGFALPASIISNSSTGFCVGYSK